MFYYSKLVLENRLTTIPSGTTPQLFIFQIFLAYMSQCYRSRIWLIKLCHEITKTMYIILRYFVKGVITGFSNNFVETSRSILKIKEEFIFYIGCVKILGEPITKKKIEFFWFLLFFFNYIVSDSLIKALFACQ